MPITKASGNSVTAAAKGDLVVGNATNDSGILSVGANGDSLVVDSSTTTGLRWQPTNSGNPIINSGFDVWQRGTSFVPASYNYGADRFSMYRAVTGSTVSRQSAGLDGFRYCARIQRDSGNTSTSDIQLLHTIETSDSIRFAGQTVTLSYWARAGANFSAASSQISLGFVYGTGTDQPLQSFTGFGFASNAPQTITTTWTRYQVTATLPTSTTEIGFYFTFTPVGTAGANDFFEVTGFQLELGSRATSYRRAGGTLAGELQAAQRYYFRNTADTAFGRFALGTSSSTTAATFLLSPPVTMRTTPTSLDTGGSLVINDFVSNYGTSTITLSGQANKSCILLDITVASGLTQYRTYNLAASNSTTAYIGASAEL